MTRQVTVPLGAADRDRLTAIVTAEYLRAQRGSDSERWLSRLYHLLVAADIDCHVSPEIAAEYRKLREGGR